MIPGKPPTLWERMWTPKGIVVVICLVIQLVTWTSWGFGGPCSKPPMDAGAAGCFPDPVDLTTGESKDGPDGFWDWTKFLHYPFPMSTGTFLAVHILWGVWTGSWILSELRYRSPHVVTHNGHWSINPEDSAKSILNGAWTRFRLGGISGGWRTGDEGTLFVPTLAIRETARDVIIPMYIARYRREELPPPLAREADMNADPGPYYLAIGTREQALMDPQAVVAQFQAIHDSKIANYVQQSQETVMGASASMVDAMRLARSGKAAVEEPMPPPEQSPR